VNQPQTISQDQVDAMEDHEKRQEQSELGDHETEKKASFAS
jgi:hypothetical protein